MYHPAKKGQRYFTMPRHSQRKISFYEGNDTGVRYFLFHSLSMLATPLQYRATQRQQIAELANTKNFDSMVVLTDEKSYNG